MRHNIFQGSEKIPVSKKPKECPFEVLLPGHALEYTRKSKSRQLQAIFRLLTESFFEPLQDSLYLRQSRGFVGSIIGDRCEKSTVEEILL